MKPVYTLEDLRCWASGGAEPPIHLGVLGDPVAHSKSPQMHNAALQAIGIQARYGRIHATAEQFPETLSLLPRLGFLGINCTIPHKSAAMRLATRLDPHARSLGVVNTLRVEDQDLVGYNTDGPGLERAVNSEFGAELGSLRVLVLGAGGGAGRAIALQCLLSGCPSLILVNRTLEKSEELFAELQKRSAPHKSGSQSLEVAAWENDALWDALRRCDLVINCTSVGMREDDPSPLATGLLPRGLLIYDTIYTAHRTALMRAGDQAGARSANGLSMLLHQGALAFEIWFNREAPLAVMRAALQESAGRT
jgi:shikimate dehydrogenase